MRLVLLIVAIITLGLYATTGDCAYCVDFRCYTSADCGQGCGCAKQPNEVHGFCMSVD